MFLFCVALVDDVFVSLAILIESLGSGTLKWREKMENKAKGHRGVKLVCDITDDDIIITGDTVRDQFSLLFSGRVCPS